MPKKGNQSGSTATAGVQTDATSKFIRKRAGLFISPRRMKERMHKKFNGNQVSLDAVLLICSAWQYTMQQALEAGMWSVNSRKGKKETRKRMTNRDLMIGLHEDADLYHTFDGMIGNAGVIPKIEDAVYERIRNQKKARLRKARREARKRGEKVPDEEDVNDDVAVDEEVAEEQDDVVDEVVDDADDEEVDGEELMNVDIDAVEQEENEDGNADGDEEVVDEE